MIHRGVIGTMERMIAYLIEKYAGAFPLWLAPVQAVVIPIADRHLEYAEVGRRELRERRLPGGGGLAAREDAGQDPRCAGAASAVHAGRGRPRSAGGHGQRPRAARGRPRGEADRRVRRGARSAAEGTRMNWRSSQASWVVESLRTFSPAQTYQGRLVAPPWIGAEHPGDWRVEVRRSGFTKLVNLCAVGADAGAPGSQRLGRRGSQCVRHAARSINE